MCFFFYFLLSFSFAFSSSASISILLCIEHHSPNPRPFLPSFPPQGSLCEFYMTTDQPAGGLPSGGYTPVSAETCLLAGKQACQVACIFQEGGPCISTFSYDSTPHGQAQNVV